MRAGDLDRIIVLERRVELGRDAFNNPKFGWLPLAEVYAAMTPVRDSERIAAQERGADITARFQIHWSPEVALLDPKDRLSCEGRSYEIVAVKEIGRREGIEITAVARSD